VPGHHEKAYICVHVASGERPVLLVSRYDDGWSFVCGEVHPDSPDAYRLVGAAHLFARDPTLNEIRDLCVDCEAERNSVGAPWIRSGGVSDKSPSAPVITNGWRIKTPDDSGHEQRDEHLRRGQAVKLAFEISERSGGTTIERMWVLVVERIGARYIGMLLNDPKTRPPNGDLCERSRIVFTANDVLDVDEPPKAYVEERIAAGYKGPH